MQKLLEDPNLRFEEKNSVKWFLTLFYIISVLFDLFYYYISPVLIKHEPFQTPDFPRLLIYFLLFTLLPVAYYLYKHNKHYQIKYYYFISYTVLTCIIDVITYLHDPGNYESGNAVEVFWLLLSPIFINIRFFRLVSYGLIARYLLVGLIIHSVNVLFPILMLAIISIFSYILLSRFQSYVNAVKHSYDVQLEGIVKGVIATLELKDPYTSGHSERVANYALILAKEIGGFTKDQLKSFYSACLLHDIGKINIPDQILMKPSSLSAEEYEIIKSHTVVGAEAISKVAGLKSSIDIIRSHHERWDGKGYPDQLKAEEIPFLARITAIADAFDAMTSSRSYRKALTADEAYKRIIEAQGTQFDPELINVFQRVYPTWKQFHSESELTSNLQREEKNRFVDREVI